MQVTRIVPMLLRAESEWEMIPLREACTLMDLHLACPVCGTVTHWAAGQFPLRTMPCPSCGAEHIVFELQGEPV